MKKIADGRNNEKQWKMEATCTGAGWNQNGKSPCYSLFELTGGDIRKRTHVDYGGGKDTYYGFVCPDCGCFTELPEGKIPYSVRSNASTYVASSKNAWD